MAKSRRGTIVERLPVRLTGADVRGPAVRGPTAMAPVAIGALAVGAVAIGRLAIGRATIKHLAIEKLDVTRLRVTELDLAGEQRMPIEQRPDIDFANLPTPSTGFLVTHFITVRSVARARAFYSDVLGGQVVLEENPCIVKLSNSWVIMNPGGGPTPDKPGISVVDHEAGDTVSTFMNLRVADIQDCYEQWRAKGAEFVTPPMDRGAEIRCYMRDPDGYLIEVGQATGLLEGRLAEKRPEDLPG